MDEPITSWREFFDAHAPRYLENPFTFATRAEVEFIIENLKLRPGDRVLDVGCGVGRHAVELAKRGMHVTGLDLSVGMLAEARKAAKAAVIPILPEAPWEREDQDMEGTVYFFEADAATFTPQGADMGGAGGDLLGYLYDAVICLCEGAFNLPEMHEEPIAHDLSILRNVYRCLRPNGYFLLTAMNGYATIRQMTDEQVAQGVFNPASMLAIYDNEMDLPEGKKVVRMKERLFIPPELVALLRHVGFEVDHVWGGTAGEWLKRPVKLDEIEAMYLCRKA